MSSLVYFDGAWSPSDAELVEEAAAEAEQADLPDVSNRPEGLASWIFTYQAADTTDLYTANRIGVSRVLVAKSAPALAEKVRRFAKTV